MKPLYLALCVVLSGLLSGLLTGCFSVRAEFGTVIPPDSVEQIQPGSTTREEVTALLGPPSAFFKPSLLDRIFGSVPAAPDAPVVEDVYTYRHVETRTQVLLIPVFYARVTASDRSRTLTVFFDEAGVVEYYGFRTDDNIEPGATTDD